MSCVVYRRRLQLGQNGYQSKRRTNKDRSGRVEGGPWAWRTQTKGDIKDKKDREMAVAAPGAGRMLEVCGGFKSTGAAGLGLGLGWAKAALPGLGLREHALVV